jgi:hypothetical protein
VIIPLEFKEYICSLKENPWFQTHIYTKKHYDLRIISRLSPFFKTILAFESFLIDQSCAVYKLEV